MQDKRRAMTIKPLGRPSSTPILNHSPSPVHTSTFAKQFSDIIRRYKYYCQHIQRILGDTDTSYREINETRVLSAGTKNYVFLFW